MREFDKSRHDPKKPLVEDKFMILEGSPEWCLLMNSLLMRDHELDVDEAASKPFVPSGTATVFDLDELSQELETLERPEEEAVTDDVKQT